MIGIAGNALDMGVALARGDALHPIEEIEGDPKAKPHARVWLPLGAGLRRVQPLVTAFELIRPLSGEVEEGVEDRECAPGEKRAPMLAQRQAASRRQAVEVHIVIPGQIRSEERILEATEHKHQLPFRAAERLVADVHAVDPNLVLAEEAARSADRLIRGDGGRPVTGDDANLAEESLPDVRFHVESRSQAGSGSALGSVQPVLAGGISKKDVERTAGVDRVEVGVVIDRVAVSKIVDLVPDARIPLKLDPLRPFRKGTGRGPVVLLHLL